MTLAVIGLQRLLDMWKDVRDQCWAENSKKSYSSRWKKYYSFCKEYAFIPLPATVTVVCLYITHLMKTLSFVSIKNYVSSLWVLHDYMGLDHVDPDNFLIKSTINGAKRILGCASRQVDPLLPEDMLCIFKCLNMKNWEDFTFWCAITLCYRCLLRASHVSVSPHTMRLEDVKFWDGGMDITVHSSKTIQYHERSQKIPVVQSSGSPLCPVEPLAIFVRRSGLSPRDCLFPYTYKSFSAKLHTSCAKAGLRGDFATHSLRRGSATYLSTFLPLHEVKCYGDWRSLAVLLYISDNYGARRNKDKLVASRLAAYV